MSPPEKAGHTDELLTSLYPQLRRIAAARMAQETPGHTLQPTALVHEAWIRLSAQQAASWGSPTQFFAAASETMRRILVDHARQRARLKRGGDWVRVTTDVTDSVPISPDEKLILIHEAITRLEQEDPERARVVVLKFFGGLSNREIAAEMSLTERTVERYWAHAKAWLFRKIEKKD
jgi:RNA polymerase sigma factor, TIGR02999 family